jgi:prepilin-type N-terminal cleavage/methylation domain-containing protein
MNQRITQSSRRTGFTLIELLVVIAIISLLVSILLPSLTKAKDLARTVVCATNEKNLGIALSIYAGDCGYYPANPDTGVSSWVRRLEEAGALEEGTYDPKPTQEGPLLCPLAESPWPGDYPEMLSSYGPTLPNNYADPDNDCTTKIRGGLLAAYGGGTEYWKRKTPKKVDLVTPGCILLIEKLLYSKSDSATPKFVCSADWNPAYYSNPGIDSLPGRYSIFYPHNETANVLFDDMHVEAIPEGSRFDENWIPE